MTYVHPLDCFDFANSLEDGSVSLLLTDPPYMGIVEDSWDNQWSSVDAYVEWMHSLLAAFKPKLTETGSVIFFGGVGKHGERPFFKLMEKIEDTNLLTYRNLITWKKRRAYGKKFDYLFCREEIAWYSVSPERTKVTFNIPLLDVKRGYAGFKQDVKVGCSTIYCHTPHEDQTSPCMSPGSQVQSKRDVLLLLRQVAVSQEPRSQSQEAQGVGQQEPSSSTAVFRRVEEAESPQEGVRKSSRKRKEARYSLQLDGGRFEGGLDRSVSSVRSSASTQHSETEQLSVSGSNRQLCWVCTRQYLRNVLESKPAQDGCYRGGVGGSSELHEVALTVKQMKYPAKSEFKRVSNVWDDIPELMRPKRTAQKPTQLMDRLISTHSNEGDLIVDPFVGFGTTGISALQLGRRFQGSEAIVADAKEANNRCREAAGSL